MLRFGIISEVDVVSGYARVKFMDDDIVSAPLQFLTRSALVDKDNFTFDINEQVACLMDENSEQGVILGAMFNDKTKPSSGGGTGIYKVKFSDDSFIEYNRNTHKYTINIQGDVDIISTGTTTVEAQTVDVSANVVSVDADSVEITAPAINMVGDVSITGEVVITGGMAATGPVASAVSIGAPSISGGGFSAGGGNASVSGTLQAANVKAGTVDLKTHIHPGVTPGGGSTGAPTP